LKFHRPKSGWILCVYAGEDCVCIHTHIYIGVRLTDSFETIDCKKRLVFDSEKKG
jgi:hypothetical protein